MKSLIRTRHGGYLDAEAKRLVLIRDIFRQSGRNKAGSFRRHEGVGGNTQARDF